MSELTPNLGLFKYSTDLDGKQVFSIDTALNDNWDILDEKVGSSRNIGEIISSTIPLTDAGLHLADGALLQGNGIYSALYNYFIDNSDNLADQLTTETDWQASVTSYGVCGKYVLDTANETLRLPKISGFIEGALESTTLGSMVEAGLPNIEGTGAIGPSSTTSLYTGAFSLGEANGTRSSGSLGFYNADFDASLAIQYMVILIRYSLNL